MEDLDQRKQIARLLLESGVDEVDLQLAPQLAALPAEAVLTADLAIPFPQGLAPIPQPLPAIPDPADALPQARVLVVTWTVAEQDGLADVLTPGFGRKAWYRYNRGFEERYQANIRRGAPALQARRLGSWFPTQVGGIPVICFKSELHLNQDGVATGEGTATLPVKDMFDQLISEVQPEVVLTVGTSGGVYGDHDLGDVVVTRGAKFRLTQEFRNEPFSTATYRSDWEIPTQYFEEAEQLMERFKDQLLEPPLGPPTKRYPFDGPLIEPPPNIPDIKLDGRDLPEFHPILTTDYFEFGTSANHLEDEGCAVEMGDAVLGLVCEELDNPPRWAVVRNLSDPQINGDLPTGRRELNMQTHWAVWYYEAYGYWTSVTGALATWAIVAGLARP
jgi:nucleoside phosphorylase